MIGRLIFAVLLLGVDVSGDAPDTWTKTKRRHKPVHHGNLTDEYMAHRRGHKLYWPVEDDSNPLLKPVNESTSKELCGACLLIQLKVILWDDVYYHDGNHDDLHHFLEALAACCMYDTKACLRDLHLVYDVMVGIKENEITAHDAEIPTSKVIQREVKKRIKEEQVAPFWRRFFVKDLESVKHAHHPDTLLETLEEIKSQHRIATIDHQYEHVLEEWENATDKQKSGGCMVAMMHQICENRGVILKTYHVNDVLHELAGCCLADEEDCVKDLDRVYQVGVKVSRHEIEHEPAEVEMMVGLIKAAKKRIRKEEVEPWYQDAFDRFMEYIGDVPVDYLQPGAQQGHPTREHLISMKKSHADRAWFKRNAGGPHVDHEDEEHWLPREHFEEGYGVMPYEKQKDVSAD